jgi:hypothetical protein
LFLGLFAKGESEKDNALMHWRSLGPAIAVDIVRYLRQRQEVSKDLGAGVLADALSLYVVPQLEDLEKGTVSAILKQLGERFPGEQSLPRRIKALFPYFTFEAED